MHEEYKAIVDAGFLLQIDDPRLVTYYMMQPDASDRGMPQVGRTAGRGAQPCAARHSARRRCATTPATAINMGPRVHDMELKDIVDIILKIRAGAFSFEAANPRHEHEWTVWEDAKLPTARS